MSILLFFTGAGIEEGLVTVVSTVILDEYREEPIVAAASIGVPEDIQTYTPEEQGLVAIAEIAEEDIWMEIRQVTASTIVIGEDGGAQTEFVDLIAVSVVLSDEYREECLVLVGAGIFGTTEIYEEPLLTVVSDVLEEDQFLQEESLTVVSVVAGEDYFYEELLVTIITEITETDLGGVAFEQPTLTVVAVVTGEDGLVYAAEMPTVYMISEVYSVDLWYSLAEQLVTIVSDVLTDDQEHYLAEEQFIALAIIRSNLMDALAPKVKGMNPRPGETAVLRNKKVGFYIVAGGSGGDGVDISTVKVKINGVEYDSGDPEFSYTGNSSQYYVEVAHPQWNYEEAVSVEINAASLCGEQMVAESYGFSVEWEVVSTRTGVGSIELYKAGDYSFDILTIEEDWVRQGVIRCTAELELWWGRYQELPYIENLEMMVQAGDTNARGKEVLENGWLSVKVGDGSFVPMFANTKIDLGPMFTHSKKSLFFKLLVPEYAATKKYFVLGLKFEPQMFFPYGRFPYARGVYSSAGNMVALAANSHVYRSYVFDAAMWNQLIALGIVTSPFWRGDDHQW